MVHDRCGLRSVSTGLGHGFTGQSGWVGMAQDWVQGPEEAMPGMTQDDEHSPHCLALSRLRIENQAQPSEVPSATSPGGVSSIRTVDLLAPCWFRLMTKHRTDW